MNTNKQLLRDECIVLDGFNFRDHDRIITLMTQNHGLIKVVVNGGNNPQRALSNLVAPLVQLELIFSPTKGDLHRFNEGKLINAFPMLRQDYSQLSTACEMARSLKESQLLWKPSPKLYQLFLFYLHALSKMNHPEILASSFRLKLLYHDGILTFDEEHKKETEKNFSEEEGKLLFVLMYCQNLSQLVKLSEEESFHKKVEQLFEEKINNQA